MDSGERILMYVKKYAAQYLKEKLSPELYFHNLRHTKEVVSAAKEISQNSNLTPDQCSIIEIAAWFHDIGYGEVYTGHEDFSMKTAESFLAEKQYSKNLIDKVLSCIHATRFPQLPDSTESKILCDADLYHLTRPNYHHYEKALRAEWNVYLKKSYTDTEWRQMNCTMLIHHEYFTEYGKNVLQKFKEVNLNLISC